MTDRTETLADLVRLALDARRRYLRGEDYTDEDLAVGQRGADIINDRAATLGKKYGRSPRRMTALGFLRDCDRIRA